MPTVSLRGVAENTSRLEVACTRCPWWAVFSTARLLAEHGDVAMSGLRHILSRNCPNHGGPSYAACDVWYPRTTDVTQ